MQNVECARQENRRTGGCAALPPGSGCRARLWSLASGLHFGAWLWGFTSGICPQHSVEGAYPKWRRSGRQRCEAPPAPVFGTIRARASGGGREESRPCNWMAITHCAFCITHCELRIVHYLFAAGVSYFSNSECWLLNSGTVHFISDTISGMVTRVASSWRCSVASQAAL